MALSGKLKLMKPIETSSYKGVDTMPPDVLAATQRLIALSKLSVDSIADYEYWLIARTAKQTDVVGCVGVESRDPHAYMESLAVHPDARRQGIGRQLVDMLYGLYVAPRDELTDLTAMTLFWNNRFYESLGFERVDPRQAKQADDIAAKEKHRYCTVWRRSKYTGAN